MPISNFSHTRIPKNTPDEYEKLSLEGEDDEQSESDPESSDDDLTLEEEHFSVDLTKYSKFYMKSAN